jgi:hypothetical protein
VLAAPSGPVTTSRTAKGPHKESSDNRREVRANHAEGSTVRDSSFALARRVHCWITFAAVPAIGSGTGRQKKVEFHSTRCR